MEFKIGDIVKANQDVRYSRTVLRHDWVGQVTKVSGGGYFSARTTASSVDPEGKMYSDLDSRYFVLGDLRFYNIKEGFKYRVMIGGVKDHGYSYEVRKGRLYNLDKRKYSTLPFNQATTFEEILEPFDDMTFKLNSISREFKFTRHNIKVGCKTMSFEDARLFCKNFGETYGFEA